MTIRQWLVKATEELANVGIVSGRLDARLILALVLNCDPPWLFAHDEDILTQRQLGRLAQLLARRLAFEPMAYIRGWREFYGQTFRTDRRALIPRPETELLVEVACDHLAGQNRRQTVVEVGTGTGAVIISLATARPRHDYFATDISLQALALARTNRRQLKATTVKFLSGHLLEPFRGRPIDVLLANLPYIARAELTKLETTIRAWEPTAALDGGYDGLGLYRQFFAQAATVMTSGVIICEHGDRQGAAMRRLARGIFSRAAIETRADYLGCDRLLIVRI